ncbi:hypothetical protein Ciccas_002545, partial [Cichlidogyrus casuarinus]
NFSASNPNPTLYSNKLKKMQITRILIHPNFSAGESRIYENLIVLANITNDIALVKLRNGPGGHMGIPMLPMPSFHTNENRLCLVHGWGCHGEKNEDINGTLAQELRLRVLNEDYCERNFEKVGVSLRLGRSRFCAGGFNCSIGVCQGDSGSGLFSRKYSRWFLEGLVSAGYEHEPDNYPSIFTKVSAFRSWISRTLRQERSSSYS